MNRYALGSPFGAVRTFDLNRGESERSPVLCGSCLLPRPSFISFAPFFFRAPFLLPRKASGQAIAPFLPP